MRDLTKRMTRVGLGLGVGASALLVASAAYAVDDETAYIFNSLNFLMHGFLVMWMAAGFCMLESGLVRSKSAATISLKNIAIYGIAGIMFWLVGYKIMYPGTMGEDWNGYFNFGLIWSASDPEGDFSGGYSSGSDWFFQMVFCATAASIVSGTLAERIKIWPFMVFTTILTGIMYPITGSWEWGTGWLDTNFGFSDFAGSTLVHSVGGWAALAGAFVLGSRIGKYNPDGSVNPMPGSMLPLATLGTFILWLGWFGFNGGSQLAMGTGADVAAISNIYINTNLAAASGLVVAMIMSQILFKKVDLSIALNGAIGGLVSITAEPLAPTIPIALMVGAVGGVIVTIAVPILDKLRIDDVVGAIPAHLLCGIWGTIIVPFSNDSATYYGQAVGIGAIGAFTFVVSLVLWLILKFTVGIRASAEDEEMGLDKAELGIEAYPEFTRR
ncbi:MAG: ammonium transporter [Alphaproteobacteria bacterium]|nr:ammonium transporter [Alphaproteobacteria bacterium]